MTHLTRSGMHQFVLWTALEAEGLGANLQHYQIVESVSTRAADMYDVPKSWDMKAQLVFGGVKEGGRPTEPKEKKSTDETLKVFGDSKM
jgi:predicted oxidoreductase (fatty acid repression mutant protein)